MKMLRWLAAALVTGVALAQTDGPGKGATAGKSDLETLLAEAFKNNPDLRAAEAKVVAAQGELDRTRRTLIQAVAKAAAELRAAQAMELESSRRYQRDLQLSEKTKAVSRDEVLISKTTWMKYKAD